MATFGRVGLYSNAKMFLVKVLRQSEIGQFGVSQQPLAPDPNMPARRGDGRALQQDQTNLNDGIRIDFRVFEFDNLVNLALLPMSWRKARPVSDRRNVLDILNAK